MPAEIPSGLYEWVDEGFDPDLPDLFQADESSIHFPCNACIHNDDDMDFCQGCRHYCQ